MLWHLAVYANRNYQKACWPNLNEFAYDYALLLVLFTVESLRSFNKIAADYPMLMTIAEKNINISVE